MGEDFQVGVCGSTWWSSPRGSIGLSPCLMGINDFGNFGWPNNDLAETKAKFSASRDVPNLIYDEGFILFNQYNQKTSESDSTLQTTNIIRPSKMTFTSTDWGQNLISGSGSNEINYQSQMMQESMSSSRLDFRQSRILNSPNNQIQKEWGMENISLDDGQDSTINELKQSTNTQGFSLDSGLPMSSSSYDYPSTLIDNLFGDDQLLIENQPMNFPSATNYHTNLNEFSSYLKKLPSLQNPHMPKQQEFISSSLMTTDTSFRNASIGASRDIKATTIFPSTQAPILGKPILHNLKSKTTNKFNQDSKKISAEPAVKRPRIETPSSLPTFKVRKEKLGDHITALQQLVSPFGKTDTASVLQEAIEYIKYLHDQVNVLSTPYMKNGAPTQQQQKNENSKNREETKRDLRSRGLCLVPISSTFPIANETTADFWTPTFGGHSDREHIQTSLNNAIYSPYLV